MANTTAMASGVNRYFAAPVSSSTGTKTMQIAKRGDKCRRRDLLRAVEHGAHQRFAHRHVAVRVLDLHRRVVHQDADGQRQPAERHHVDGLARAGSGRSAR